MAVIAWYTLSSILAMRFVMVCSFLLLRFFLLRCCCAVIACSRGRALAHCVLTSVIWRNPDVRRLLVLDAGLAAITAARAATFAARTASVAAAVAAFAAAITLRVRLTGPSVGAGVGVCRCVCSCIVAVSLAIDIGVGTLGSGRAVVAGRSAVGSTLRAGACIAVTD